MPDIKKYLNRDGLDEYNSLLPHSSAEMQTYVNDWLDEHPEATTTVQDGAITEPKLADKSVSLRTLADDTVHMLKGAILTGNLGGNVLTADDAYSAPPVTLTIEGKSTQDGTPTPDAPVEIVSIVQDNLTFVGSNLLNPNDIESGYIVGYGDAPNKQQCRTATKIPVTSGASYVASYANSIRYVAHLYVNWNDSVRTAVSATLPSGAPFKVPAGCNYVRLTFGTPVGTLQDAQLEAGTTATPFQPYDGINILLNLTQALRSLPDGTHDTLSFAYLRPSTREGWAWYTPTLVQNVALANMGELAWSTLNYSDTLLMYANIADMVTAQAAITTFLCSGYVAQSSKSIGSLVTMPNLSCAPRNAYKQVYVKDSNYTDAEIFKAAVAGMTLLYPLATPTTETLDPIKLPVLPAPNVTVWSDPSTGLQMEYVRNANIVIQNIEQAIADQ